MKKKPIFAMRYIQRGETKFRLSIGFFYALLIIAYGFTTPCWSSNTQLPLWCNATGSVEPFFYFHHNIKPNVTVMRKPENICSSSSERAPESTLDARNALTLLFTSQYPNFEFTISDTGDSYILDVKERNGDIAFTQQASELAMLTVLTNNQLVQCCEITETFVTIYRDNMLSLVKDIDALRCKLNKFITMG